MQYLSDSQTFPANQVDLKKTFEITLIRPAWNSGYITANSLTYPPTALHLCDCQYKPLGSTGVGEGIHCTPRHIGVKDDVSLTSASAKDTTTKSTNYCITQPTYSIYFKQNTKQKAHKAKFMQQPLVGYTDAAEKFHRENTGSMSKHHPTISSANQGKEDLGLNMPVASKMFLENQVLEFDGITDEVVKVNDDQDGVQDPHLTEDLHLHRPEEESIVSGGEGDVVAVVDQAICEGEDRVIMEMEGRSQLQSNKERGPKEEEEEEVKNVNVIQASFKQPDTFSPSNLPLSSTFAGGAATRRETEKRRKYSELMTNFIFIPVTIETSGTWGIEGLNFIKEIDQRISRVSQNTKSKIYSIPDPANQYLPATRKCGFHPRNITSRDGARGDISYLSFGSKIKGFRLGTVVESAAAYNRVSYQQQLHCQEISRVPMLTPDLIYKFETVIECIAEIGISDQVRIFIYTSVPGTIPSNLIIESALCEVSVDPTLCNSASSIIHYSLRRSPPL
ncbi:hypothetical protein C0J52_23228 [Blattella germanica]|nr:hypothetical protein C0J52_23228 [Blattella germanica]